MTSSSVRSSDEYPILFSVVGPSAWPSPLSSLTTTSMSSWARPAPRSRGCGPGRRPPRRRTMEHFRRWGIADTVRERTLLRPKKPGPITSLGLVPTTRCKPRGMCQQIPTSNSGPTPRHVSSTLRGRV
jgi:hypothetical protein